MKTACLLFSCPDQPGIVADISKFLFDRKLNIIDLEQHSEDETFFTRIEWEDLGNFSNKADFSAQFESISKRFRGKLETHFFNKPQKLGLFVSREAHVLLEILSRIEMQEFGNIEISFIIGNFEEIEPISKRHKIPFYYTSTQTQNYESTQIEIIKKYRPDFIGLARYMKVLSENFIQKSACPIINIHHSFLPSFVGAKPYEMAYEKGVKLIGATSHFVTPELDQGPIIEQETARIRSGYSVEDIRKIGRTTEKQVFAEAIKKALEHKIIVYKNRTIIFE